MSRFRMPDNPDEMLDMVIRFAYEKISEACLLGTITLKNGVEFAPADPGFSVMLQHYREVAKLKPPKKAKVALPEDFLPKTTQKTKGEGA